MPIDPGAFDIGEPTATDFTGFEMYRQIVLVTYKRSGEAVPSPINHGVDQGVPGARSTSAPMKVLERGLDRGSQAFGMPIAFIEVTPAGRPTEPGTHPRS